MAFLKQEDRPLVFTLFSTHLSFSLSSVPLAAILGKPGTVHPESYTYRRVSRGAALNTMGSAFLDDFGEGIGTIVIEGQTGWKGGDFGLLQFKNLELMFIEYHRRRDALRDSATIDPGTIHLWLIDTLNLEASEVYPIDFYLVRSRARPQLFQYRIQLLVLSDLLQTLISDVFGAVSQLITNPASIIGPATSSVSNVVQDLGGIATSFENTLHNFFA